LVNAEGKGTFVRYWIVGNEGVDDLSLDDVKGRDPKYLQNEVKERLAKGQSFELKLLAQIAADGDTTDDITSYWPEDREVVPLGTIKVEGTADDADGKESKHIIFDPVPRVDGIEASKDPILEVRASVYLLGGRERRAA
jgi:catalase